MRDCSLFDLALCLPIVRCLLTTFDSLADDLMGKDREYLLPE